MEQRKHFRKRDAIYACLQETKSHPSAEWLYEHLRSRCPDISLATVYRNLAKFREEGRICSVGTVNGVERFDANTMPHPHFICDRCGSVQDLDGFHADVPLLEMARRAIRGRVDQCTLCFHGLCEQCQNENQI